MRHTLNPSPPALQPIGRAFALVQPAYENTTLTSEPIKPVDEKVEVIKVCCKQNYYTHT